MAASLFESQLYGGAFNAGDAGRLFSDSANRPRPASVRCQPVLVLGTCTVSETDGLPVPGNQPDLKQVTGKRPTLSPRSDNVY